MILLEAPCLFQLIEFPPAFLGWWPLSPSPKLIAPASAFIVTSPSLTLTLLPPSYEDPCDDVGPIQITPHLKALKSVPSAKSCHGRVLGMRAGTSLGAMILDPGRRNNSVAWIEMAAFTLVPESCLHCRQQTSLDKTARSFLTGSVLLKTVRFPEL